MPVAVFPLWVQPISDSIYLELCCVASLGQCFLSSGVSRSTDDVPRSGQSQRHVCHQRLRPCLCALECEAEDRSAVFHLSRTAKIKGLRGRGLCVAGLWALGPGRKKEEEEEGGVQKVRLYLARRSCQKQNSSLPSTGTLNRSQPFCVICIA